MKNLTLTHLVAIVCMGVAGQANAQTGTVNLTVTAADFRINPYATARDDEDAVSPAGARQTNRFRNPETGAPSTIPFRRAWVSMTITRNGTSSMYCRRTDDFGQVQIPWISALPATATISVRPEAINATVSSCDQASADFTILTGTPVTNEISIILFQSKFALTAGNRTLTTTVGGTLGSIFQEAVSAYLTSLETLEMQDANGLPFTGTTSTRNSVKGFQVFINDPNGLNVAPTFDRIITSVNRTTLKPVTMAHEIGHLVAWNNLNLSTAIINPVVDYQSYGNTNPVDTWSHTSEECTKVAFHEGFADAHAGLWMWHRNADPSPVLAVSFPGVDANVGDITGGDLALEANGATASTDASCGDFVPAVRYRHSACVTAALWDLVDNSPNDGDGVIAADLSDLVGAFRSYRDDWGCFWPNDNRCKNEGFATFDPDGNNWKDFASAAAASPNITAAQLTAIQESSLELGGTPND